MAEAGGASGGRAGQGPEGGGRQRKNSVLRRVGRGLRRIVTFSDLRKNKRRVKVRSVRDIEILDEIGAGSFGVVSKVVLRKPRETPPVVYALKRVERGHEGVDEKLLAEEQRLLSMVDDHPGVVKLYCHWKTRDHHFFVLEYVSGGDMFDAFRANGAMDPARAARYCHQAALALEYIHSKRIIFRDLKLENLLLRAETDEVLLIDFGLAKQVKKQPDGRTHSVCGTIEYMAPEMLAMGEAGYTSSVDWWCLGVMAYLLMVGKYPFGSGKGELRRDQGPEDQDLMLWRIRHGGLTLPAALPDGAERAIEGLLEADPSKRVCGLDAFGALEWVQGRQTMPPPEAEGGGGGAAP